MVGVTGLKEIRDGELFPFVGDEEGGMNSICELF